MIWKGNFLNIRDNGERHLWTLTTFSCFYSVLTAHLDRAVPPVQVCQSTVSIKLCTVTYRERSLTDLLTQGWPSPYLNNIRTKRPKFVIIITHGPSTRVGGRSVGQVQPAGPAGLQCGGNTNNIITGLTKLAVTGFRSRERRPSSRMTARLALMS